MLDRAFVDELSHVLNKHSIDALLGVPDFILSAQLANVIAAQYNAGLDTARWRGVDTSQKVRQFESQDPEFLDVMHFNEKFDLLVGTQPRYLAQRKANERIEFMQEELNEFKLAVANNDLTGMADALIDLVYVAKGTAVMMGLPWRELWDDVHRANMDKIRGATKRGHMVDVTKPRGWLGPQTAAILEAYGLDYRNAYCTKGADDEIYQAAAALNVDPGPNDPPAENPIGGVER